MNVRRITALLLIVMVSVAGAAWMRQANPAAPTSAPQTPRAESGTAGSSDAAAPSVEAAANPGLEWTAPRRWRAEGDRPMRIATYSIPAAAGDAEGAECAVFYFGPQQGGGVDANVRRWASQFENAGTPQRSVRKVAGMNVTRVEVKGSYLAPSGPMMQSQGSRPGYTLLGAIAEGPNGAVFFKLTGPEKSVRAAAKEFDGLIASLRK